MTDERPIKDRLLRAQSTLVLVDAEATIDQVLEERDKRLRGDVPALPQPAIVTPKPKRWGYAPKDGHVFNPLGKWPVNEPCWCGSTKKAKKCCLPGHKLTLTVEAASGFEKLMKRGQYGRELIRRAFVMNAEEVAKTQPEGMTIGAKVEDAAGA